MESNFFPLSTFQHSASIAALVKGVGTLANERLYQAQGERKIYETNFARLQQAWRVKDFVRDPFQRAFRPYTCAVPAADGAEDGVDQMPIPKSPCLLGSDVCSGTALRCPKLAINETAQLTTKAVHRLGTVRQPSFIVDEAQMVEAMPVFEAIVDAFTTSSGNPYTSIAAGYAEASRSMAVRILRTPWRTFSRHFPQSLI
ncbi:MAG TPA: hypothetical protein VK196_13200 [Magnetospirillum sp.]|nr:hypothetical protein [Magnetospirillum sp.]